MQPDFLGRAYEYLLRKFAEGSGQSAGEFFTPTEVGFLMAGIKEVAETRIGDTITTDDRPAEGPLPGFKPMKPMVFSGLYPTDSGQYQALRDALEKVPDIKLISIDFEHAEGMFSYDPAVAFKNVKPDKIVESFDQKIRGASNSTLWHAWTTTPGRPPGPDRLHDRRSARLLPRCSIAPGGPAELFHPRDE